MDVCIAVQEAMNDQARETVLASAYAANPQLRGAQVADVLDMYVSHDGCLFFTEPLWAQYKSDIPSELGEYYHAASVAVALMLGSSEEPNPLTWLLVELLAQKAGESEGVVVRP
jgi:hypothetical protein